MWLESENSHIKTCYQIKKKKLEKATEKLFVFINYCFN